MKVNSCPWCQASRFETYFAPQAPKVQGAGYKARLESRIKRITPHLIDFLGVVTKAGYAMLNPGPGTGIQTISGRLLLPAWGNRLQTTDARAFPAWGDRLHPRDGAATLPRKGRTTVQQNKRRLVNGKSTGQGKGAGKNTGKGTGKGKNVGGMLFSDDHGSTWKVTAPIPNPSHRGHGSFAMTQAPPPTTYRPCAYCTIFKNA